MRTCIKCGRSESETPFKPKRNLCMDDWRKYKRNYDKETGQSAVIQKWKVDNRIKHRATCRAHHATPVGNMKHRLRVQKTWRSWLDHLMSAIKRHSTHPGPHDPKSGPRRDFNITVDYLVNLVNAQDGLCDETGIQMAHEMGNLMSASIDRIDANKGHTIGNIRIVCQWVNYARKHYSVEEFKRCLDAYYQARLNRNNKLTINPHD